MATAHAAPGARSGPPRSRRARARAIGLGVSVAYGVVFALLNLDSVQVNWVVATWDTPLLVVILFSAAAGAVASRLAGRRGRRRRERGG